MSVYRGFSIRIRVYIEVSAQFGNELGEVRRIEPSAARAHAFVEQFHFGHITVSPSP